MAKLNWVPHAVSQANSYGIEERDATGGIPHSVTSISTSSSGFANIAFTQKMLDEVNRKKSLKKDKSEKQVMRKRKHNLVLLNSYFNKAWKSIEEMHYQIHLY